ncbi:unnamed protein product [Prorocentrum cordatum]|uniref:Pre-mRNA-splicing factor 38 n=1 Tax=Prorocentrum cordatum TaxID=2364126 RepID=A0ABN9S0Z0_9DINO|nr:unnamed protein product [Polarella glacialis]
MQRSGDAVGCDHSYPSLARKRQPREEEEEDEEEGRRRERRRRERERHRKRRSSQPTIGEPWRASGGQENSKDAEFGIPYYAEAIKCVNHVFLEQRIRTRIEDAITAAFTKQPCKW